jgi:ABC-type sugar transport system ATPase subunit
MSTALLEARAISKRFGGTQALSGVDLSLQAGEVHCLVGENGAGKSTLGKVVAGVVAPDAGTLTLDGRKVGFRAPRDALATGIAIVEQELALVPAMTVEENVRLGQRRVSRRAVQQLNDECSLDLDLDVRVEGLPVAEQQKVELLRALARRARIVVMDEPTARLAGPEARNLRDIVRRLADRGTAVVYVSHFLEEVLDVGDRITVLRNGAVVRSGATAGQTADDLVAAMLGRAAVLSFPAKRPPQEDASDVLSVRGLSGLDQVHDVSLNVRRGEIVGLAGLVGSGRTEVARLIFGADRRSAGAVELEGRPVSCSSPHRAIGDGIAYLPESRKDLGLFLRMSVQENVTLSALDGVCRLGMVSGRRERAAGATMLQRIGVQPPDPALAVGTLSGGNQQKVLFAKWLWPQPRLLIADEPTRGVDIGAKFAIYKLLAELAADGLAVLLISSELEEVVGLCHRVVVMARGRPVATFAGDEITEDRILHAAFDSKAASSNPRQAVFA